MAELTSFSFRPGHTRLHGLDVRFKMILMVLLSLATVNAGAAALSLLSAVMVMLGLHIRLSVRSTLRELRYFFLLLALVFLARLVSTPGTVLAGVGFITMTQSGLVQGILVCWRLMLVVGLGLFFVSTTRIAHIKWAMEWFLAPIPWIPAQRVATMMGLIVRFIPVIFNKSREVSDAQKARCSQHMKNPFIRVKRLIFPMARRVFQDAENIAVAMTARCYSEQRTRMILTPGRSDWWSLCLGLLFSLTLFNL